jgi:hypothetical protein
MEKLLFYCWSVFKIIFSIPHRNPAVLKNLQFASPRAKTATLRPLLPAGFPERHST